MLMAPSTPPASPTGDGHTDGQHRPFAPSSSLNPLASPFSPSFPSGSAVEELPKWLLFSPSSLEGRSGRPSSVSSAPSSAEVARRASSSSHTAGSRSASPVVTYAGAEIPPFVHHEGKAPAVDAGPLVPRNGAPDGFMADARRAPASVRATDALAAVTGSADQAATSGPSLPVDHPRR
jgi:hypothetical protein